MPNGGVAPLSSPNATVVVESPNLDLLRSAAVAFVVVFHIELFFGGAQATAPEVSDLGRWGVLIFFVHTALVLMQSLERHLSSFIEFLVRRCFRIFPLCMFFVMIIAVFRLPVGHLRQGHFYSVPLPLSAVLANLFLVENFTHFEPAEAPLWSLPLEMQMYIVLPAAYAFLGARRRAVKAMCLWLFAFAVGIAWMSWRHLQIPMYAPCFAAGIVASALWDGHRVLRWQLWPVALAAVTLCYLSRPSLISSWLSCLVLGLAATMFREMPKGILRRTCQLIARYSYGVYLSHFILIWFAFEKLAHWPMLARVGVFLLTTVSVPIALYHLIESPMISMGGKVARLLNLRSMRLKPSLAMLAPALASGTNYLLRAGSKKLNSARANPT